VARGKLRGEIQDEPKSISALSGVTTDGDWLGDRKQVASFAWNDSFLSLLPKNRVSPFQFIALRARVESCGEFGVTAVAAE
jgi:hypothetical protein